MKKIALVLCLLLLVSCGAQTVDPATDETKRTSEQQLVDKHLTTILREQLSGAYDVKDATFTYANTEELEGKECFTYEMKKDEIAEVFAIATDGSIIFHLEGKDFVKIFDIN